MRKPQGGRRRRRRQRRQEPPARGVSTTTTMIAYRLQSPATNHVPQQYTHDTECRASRGQGSAPASLGHFWAP